jgi:tRNA(fMet)-specific endonuclease VapC
LCDIRAAESLIALRASGNGEQEICTSIIVAAELRYGAAKKASERLIRQLEVVLSAVDVLALGAPTDTVYGELRRRRTITAAILTAASA